MTPQSTVGTGSELPAKSAALHARAGRPRDDAREQAILDASIELLCQVGYDVMSIESVAARSGT
ncbi:MAG: hypothetical protein ACRDYY_09710, partial [Acidimicrobiales bacterium]